jgi:hypothetical protein
VLVPVMAFAFEASGVGNVIGLCLEFFNVTADLSTAMTSFRDGSLVNTPDFILLHEVQHLSAIVGSPRRCTDQPGPKGGLCYTPGW